ncbi:hypothetical protein ANCDUO_19324 [Ancylostoma duodenale]|uniref:Uncharacterized protein n=1 Tax=Ancylostoma duodenale TaxID=51022 RepID=A0A0C2FPZ7_9BILA|nr:hypothetical protein ANCDUO_19324 [Ancylostoma duodenale]
MTTANPQRQCPLFRKFSTEVRPPPLLRRDERIRSMTCSFEEIAESEEEDIQKFRHAPIMPWLLRSTDSTQITTIVHVQLPESRQTRRWHGCAE